MEYAIEILEEQKRMLADELLHAEGEELDETYKRHKETCEALNKLNLPDVSDTLIAWEQFKKANWYESEAIDVEKMLMDKFQAIYGR